MSSLFAKVQLRNNALQALRDFYVGSLGLPLVSEQADRFCVAVGESELEFLAAEPETQPIYHIAFNIPENQIMEALSWTRSRAEILVKSDGSPIYDFATWDAHAFYFSDPAGNLLEMIARHTLSNASDEHFGAASITCVSEVGVATPDVPETVQNLIDQLGIRCYPDPEAPMSEEFQAVGDENGLFVVAKVGRSWLGSDKSAHPVPTKVRTRSGIELEFHATHA
jgi:catechol-2,3-dioxygenase